MNIDLSADELSVMLWALDIALDEADAETCGDEDSPEVAKFDRLEALQRKLTQAQQP